jgi:hypothetical protein
MTIHGMTEPRVHELLPPPNFDPGGFSFSDDHTRKTPGSIASGIFFFSETGD